MVPETPAPASLKAAPPTGRRLELALLGSRGIPARYGGYETFYEELATRLVARGHGVTVYCRRQYTDPSLRSHRGVRLVTLPTLRGKYTDTPIHSLLSALHASGGRFDAALMVNAANALFVPILRLARVPTALHVDGLEQDRGKWGVVGRTVYRLSERLATRVPTLLVTDAEVIRRHFLERHGADSTMIPYGVSADPPERREWLERLGLEPDGYLLYVSRFEPENNPHRVAEAYRRVQTDLPLVMVGDAPYADRFIASFRRDADPRILFPGAIYGDGYRELQAGARLYIHATEVGGTHPALVEAMGYGNCVLVHDTPENREVAGEVARYFNARRPETLSRELQELLASSEEVEERGRAARRRTDRLYDWESVVDRYERLFARLVAGGETPSR